MVFLLETKNKVGVLERIRRHLLFPNSCYVDLVGTAGGLALWWQDEVDIGMKSGGILRCVISMLNTKWLTTFIYATLRASQREVFWNCIWRIAWENQLPWLYIGDFSDYGSIWEKKGVQDPIYGELKIFRKCCTIVLSWT